MSAHEPLTDAQHEMIGALDDAADHVMYEWDQPDPNSVGTCGFAHIGNIDGRGSFVSRIKSLADRGHRMVEETRRGYEIHAGSLDLSLTKDSHRGGYRLTISNIPELVGGPAHQRIDVRENLHRMLLHRLQVQWDMLHDASVTSRMD